MLQLNVDVLLVSAIEATHTIVCMLIYSINNAIILVFVSYTKQYLATRCCQGGA